MSLLFSYRNKENWKSYYDILIEPEKLFAINEEECNENCKEFIKIQFAAGQKEDVFNLQFAEKYKNEGKHAHTISLYLLGLYLAGLFKERICCDVNRKIPPIDKSIEWYNDTDYKYTWFMTSLYHDIASCIEKSDYKNIHELSCENLFSNPKFNRYNKNTVKNYWKYRKHDNKQDHGIYGGVLLHEKLNDIYGEMTSDKRLPVNENGLVWREEHLDHYKYVADAIVTHNMWTVSSEDKEAVQKYEHAELMELIIDDEKKKLSITDYPLHFMLCLLDTIEPVKRFNNLSPYEVLNSISIDIVKDENGKIEIRWNKTIRQQPQFWDWMKNISTMPEWMNVQVSSCDCSSYECSLTISIPLDSNNMEL